MLFRSLVMTLSAASSDGDDDFALNMAAMVAASRPREGVLFVDLALPASNTAIAFGIDLNFRVKEAVKEMARLDRALLDSALASCPRSGLYILPLALHGEPDGWAVDIHDLRALLEICRSLYDVVIVSCGPFSRQEEILSLPEEGALLFLPCNQRFTSIKAAAELLRLVRNVRGGRDAVDTLLDDDRVQAVSFVGSSHTARPVYARAAAAGKRVQCQGGAKNPIVIAPDAHLDSTVQVVADSAFGCAGQRCLAASVAVLVGDARAPFRDSLRDAAASRITVANSSASATRSWQGSQISTCSSTSPSSGSPSLPSA